MTLCPQKQQAPPGGPIEQMSDNIKDGGQEAGGQERMRRRRKEGGMQGEVEGGMEGGRREKSLQVLKQIWQCASQMRSTWGHSNTGSLPSKPRVSAFGLL